MRIAYVRDESDDVNSLRRQRDLIEKICGSIPVADCPWDELVDALSEGWELLVFSKRIISSDDEERDARLEQLRGIGVTVMLLDGSEL